MNKTSGQTPQHAPSDVPYDAHGAWQIANFRYYWIGNFLAVVGMQMQTMAVGWDVYERTHEAIALGLVGLIEMLPVFVLALVAGHVADRFNRKRIVMVSMGVVALSSVGLAVSSAWTTGVLPLYGCLLVGSLGRAFQQPAKAAFLPQIVPRQHFAGAVAWSLGGFQLASVTGPVFGGLLLLISPSVVYLGDAATALCFVGLLTIVSDRSAERTASEPAVGSLTSGVGFVWRNKVLLGAMTLDMLAVTLGGAVALLPIYAQDILRIGPTGFGVMQAAPAVGALAMSVLLVYGSPLVRAGHKLMWSVAGFGVATIVFGFSHVYWLSLLMLFLIGVFDSISVVIRHTLVQLLTPDAMRGRVSAINGIFIGASNKLGGFESGLVAHLFTPTISVVSGGVGTLVVVAMIAVLFPQLRCYGMARGALPPRGDAALVPPEGVVSVAEAEIELGGTPYGATP